MRINHRQLEAFRAMIETKTVTKAAERLFISQPATSRLLSDLECKIGFSLFNRERKRLTPTFEALLLYDEVLRSFVSLDHIAVVANEIATFRRGSLHIVGFPALTLTYIPKIVAEFTKKYPDIKVSIEVRSSQKVIQSIALQQFDIGFVGEINSDQKGLNIETLAEGQLQIVLPKDHSLCEKDLIEANDLIGEKFISLGDNYPIQILLNKMLLDFNIKVKNTISTQLSLTAVHLVAQGAGIALVDPITAYEFEDLLKIEVRPFRPALPYSYFSLLPSLRPKTRNSELFLNIVRTHLEDRLLV